MQNNFNSKLMRDSGVLGEQIYSGKYDTKKFFLDINTEKLAQFYHKQKGKYTTLNCSREFHMSEPARKFLIKKLVEILKEYLGEQKGTILVVGLGNAFLVADSLGAQVVKNLFATHYMPADVRADLGDLSALIPGVSGINGFSTADIVSGVVHSIKPKTVILIDALTANTPERLGCSFQFSDTGISPGAGIGNKNKPLNKKTLKTDVIAIGVPLMINASYFGYDRKNYIVTPKEIDIYTKFCARVLSHTINEAVHGKNYKNYI